MKWRKRWEGNYVLDDGRINAGQVWRGASRWGADGIGCGPTFRRRCDAKRWVECAAAGMSQAPRIERAAR